MVSSQRLPVQERLTGMTIIVPLLLSKADSYSYIMKACQMRRRMAALQLVPTLASISPTRVIIAFADWHLHYLAFPKATRLSPARTGANSTSSIMWAGICDTLNALTGSLIYRFEYDDAGCPRAVIDGDGNTTLIERDARGNPTTIVGPYGKGISLTVGAGGYLSRIANTAGEAVDLEYADGGLLTALKGPSDQFSRFRYDDVGRLTRDENPAGGFTALARTEFTGGSEVGADDRPQARYYLPRRAQAQRRRGPAE